LLGCLLDHANTGAALIVRRARSVHCGAARFSCWALERGIRLCVSIAKAVGDRIARSVGWGDLNAHKRACHLARGMTALGGAVSITKLPFVDHTNGGCRAVH
jgi:hypothetical protein